MNTLTRILCRVRRIKTWLLALEWAFPRVGGGTAKKVYLYKNGDQKVSWESPGSYYATGYTTTPMSFLSDRISAVVGGGSSIVCLAGTVAKVDLTNYVALHIKARRNSGTNGGVVRVLNSKSDSDRAAETLFLTSGSDYVEYVLNVSNISGEKYIELNVFQNMDADISEVWLTES